MKWIKIKVPVPDQFGGPDLEYSIELFPVPEPPDLRWVLFASANQLNSHDANAAREGLSKITLSGYGKVYVRPVKP